MLEDATVTDILTHHRLELGVGSGATDATFSAQGAATAGVLGHGLMLCHTQPRRHENHSLEAIQQEVIDAYLEALPAGMTPRILVSRTVLAVDELSEGEQWQTDYKIACNRRFSREASQNHYALNEHTTIQDAFLGTAAEVEVLLAQNSVLARATHLCFQSHTVESHYALRIARLRSSANR